MNRKCSESRVSNSDTSRFRGLSDYSTPEGLANRYADLFTLPQIRWALRWRNENGLSEHVTRMGRRLYIHVPGFTTWFRERGREAK
jgi:hypothetical protein